ncbi:Chromosome segregation in meiosis protein [Pleurotus pulmonarius]
MEPTTEAIDNEQEKESTLNKRPLFLPSDSDDETPASPKIAPRPASPPPSDALDLFDDDAFTIKPLGPAVNVEALERDARARQASQPSYTPHQILPSSSPPRHEETLAKDKDSVEPRPGMRKRIPRLDEGRLLGRDGFPALMKSVKGFKIKGKGHEVEDLDRLFLTYEFWTHQLYPKTQFRDTVERVEKLCHSRRMHVALGVYRDEAHGKIVRDEDVIDLTDEDDNAREPPASEPASEPASSRVPSEEPSRGQTTDFDDDEFEAAIREEEQRSRPTKSPERNVVPPKPKATFGQAGDDDFMDVDGDLWDQLIEGAFDESAGNVSGNTTAPKASEGNDDDIWDVVDEVEREQGGTTIQKAPAPVISEAEENWEDMYF